MKILLSPAKKLNFDPEFIDFPKSEIQFEKETEKLIKILKKKKPKTIAELMHLSPALAELNYNRYQDFEFPLPQNHTKTAVFAFDGEVYSGLNIRTLPHKSFKSLQDNVRILSGLYGLLKPMDAIMPYRLEMGTSLKINAQTPNLYRFWTEKLTKQLTKELIKDEEIINLASAEYSKVLDWKKIKNPVITPQFKEVKNGKASVVMVYTKQARGIMARYIIENQISNVNEIKNFSLSGYSFNQEFSSEKEWVFVR